MVEEAPDLELIPVGPSAPTPATAVVAPAPVPLPSKPGPQDHGVLLSSVREVLRGQAIITGLSLVFGAAGSLAVAAMAVFFNSVLDELRADGRDVRLLRERDTSANKLGTGLCIFAMALASFSCLVCASKLLVYNAGQRVSAAMRRWERFIAAVSLLVLAYCAVDGSSAAIMYVLMWGGGALGLFCHAGEAARLCRVSRGSRNLLRYHIVYGMLVQVLYLAQLVAFFASGDVSDAQRLLWRCVVHPLFIEVSGAMSRYVMHSFDGRSTEVSSFFLFLLLGFGNVLGRWQLTVFRDGGTAVVAVLLATAVDVVLRLTITARDRVYYRAVLGRARADALIAASGARVKAIAKGIDEVSEGGGTIVAAALALAFRTSYSRVAPAADGVLLSMALQLLLETVADMGPHLLTLPVNPEAPARGALRRALRSAKRNQLQVAVFLRRASRWFPLVCAAVGVNVTMLVTWTLHSHRLNEWVFCAWSAAGPPGFEYHKVPCWQADEWLGLGGG